MRLRFCLTDKFIAGFIALSLCLSTNLPELKAEAAAPRPGSVPLVNAMDVSIPEDIGTLKEKFEGRDGRIVFILQDAHAIPDAQRNIQKIIDYVQREYGVDLVGLEGAALPLDTLLLQSFPDQARLREVFDDYFQRGELTGASAAALFNESPSFYQGVEDWTLYEEGLGLFLQASELESSLISELNRLFSALETEKEKIYSPELLRVDRAIEDYHNNKGDLAGLLETLALVQAPEPGSETALLLEEMKSSGGSDEILDREVRRFAEEIRAALSGRSASEDVRRDLALFNLKFQEFQNSLIAPEALALFLKELALKYQIRTQISEPLRKKIMTQKRIRELEGTKLFDQIEIYARSVKSSLFKSHQERTLDTLGREYGLIRKLGRLELSRSEWLELKKLLSRQEAWPIRQDGVDGAEDASRLLSRMTPNVEFYRNTEKRDAALFVNTESLMRSRSERSALLVAGGFHADALTYQLKAKGISYVLVMPAISNLPAENSYREHMNGKVSWSGYFEARGGRVNLYEAFVRGARDALLDGLSRDRGPALKLWRDSVIRALAARGRVSEASEYTRFIDEASEPQRRVQNDFLEQWKRSVESFTEKFKELRSADQLTQEAVARLFTPAMIPAATDISMARSELRMELLPAVLAQLALPAGLSLEAPAAGGVLQDHGKKIQLLVTQGIARDVRENSRVLEMGIGSGVMTKILMESAVNTPGVSFLGLDINPEAVTAARQLLGTAQTALRMKPSFEVRESDLFSAVKGNEIFDVIFWNPPWSSETSEGVLSLAKNDPGFVTLRRFLREAENFLAPQGKIFLILPPESMEEIWEDAQLLYDISPVPMFERTERRRIGLYTLSARSELRAAAPSLEYDLNEETLNQDFWKWFNEELPERELERELFEKIVTGDDAVLRGLLKAYPEKVYVREVVRGSDPESWELNEHDGRTVYLKLSQGFGEIHTLRLKGVRPRADEEGNFLGYHAGGRGFVPLDADPAGPGKLRFSLREGEYKVFGGSREASARHERDVIQDMRASDLLKPHVDASLAVGIYRTAGFKGEKLGFSVIGMRGADRRIRPSVVMDDEDEDEDGRKLILSVSDYETHEMTPLSSEAAARFALAQGRLMRLYHDAGLYHGYPHFENFGLVPGADFNNLKMEDLIARDLGSTVRLKDISAEDEKTRRETAAMYRWMDLAKSVRYFRRHDNQNNYFELQLEFLKGYTGSETEARALYEPMSQFSFDLALQYYYSEKHYVSEKEKVLDFSLPQYASSLNALYEKTKQMEAAAEAARRAADGDIRSSRRQAEMALADLEAAPDVLAQYAIGKVLEILPTEGGVGEHGKSLLITAEQGRFVLKPLTTALYQDLKAGARFEVSVVRELVRQGFPAADLVPSDKPSAEVEEDRYFIEASNGKIYLLYRVTEGHTVPVEALTAAQRENSVRLLAGMHEALRVFTPRGSRIRPSIFDFSGTAEKFKQLQEALLKRQRETPGYFSTRAERFFLEYADFILEQISLLNLNLPPPVIEQLPVTLIHGDFHPLNMTYEGSSVRGVFDWDHLRNGFRADDLFHGIFDLKDEREKFNLKGLQEITNLYDRVQPLTPAEFQALPEMARRQFIEYLTWIVRPEKLAERHLYDLSSVDPLEQGLRILDLNEPVFSWFLSNIRVLRDIDAKIASGEFSRAIARSELRAGDELIRSWNEEHYFRQLGKPDDEPGHLGVQFRDVNMETGPGSIYEFDFLKEAAREFLSDVNLDLRPDKYSTKGEIERILQVFLRDGVIDEEGMKAALEAFAILEKSGSVYNSVMRSMTEKTDSYNKLTMLQDSEAFFQRYYPAASLTFRIVPILVEAMYRKKEPGRITSSYEAEDGLEVQSEASLHFTLTNGFEFKQREQLGLPAGVDPLTYFREDPSRVTAVYLRAIEFELPLSHSIRKALMLYQAEFQAWADQERRAQTRSKKFQDMGRNFLNILSSDQSVIDVLWEMYRSGVLDAVIPEMKNVRDLPSDMSFHAFTVGQHTMYNLRKLEDLRVTDDERLAEGRKVANQLSGDGLRQIRLILLLHDLGKKQDKKPAEPDHAIVSARDIVPARMKEFGLPEKEIGNIAWVVRDHMVLNAFSRLRDTEFKSKLPVLLKTVGLDPELSSEKLNLLYLISLTDRASLHPWKEITDPGVLNRLNSLYQSLDVYFITSKNDRFRHIEDMQLEAHEAVRLEWADYKRIYRERLRAALAGMSAIATRGYFRKVPVVEEGKFDAVRQALIDRAKAISSDDAGFDYLLERLFAAFTMDQIRQYSDDEAVEKLLFLLHLDYLNETGSTAPVIYFKPLVSRTYERSYEIIVGASSDRPGFFERATGVLFKYRFDIEEADVRTLSNGHVVDTFYGFFQDYYPDERSHMQMQDQMTRDFRDVSLGTVPSIEALFTQAGKPYVSVRTIGPIGTEVQFLDDTEIYGTRASVFNLKTANRLGLLHTLSLALNQRGINLVAAPVSTHPSMVNDTFYVNRNGEVLGSQEKEQLSSVVQALFSEASIDLSGMRSELRVSHLDLLWPDGVTDRDFAGETFQAWKSDWLADDTLAAGLKAWVIGDTLTFEFTGQDGRLVSKGELPVSLKIRQNDAGKIMAIESKGYPGIDSKEMLRGVLNWMKTRGVDYVQMDVTYPAFLEAVREEWNRTRVAGPDPYVLPVRPAGNGTRMYFYLKLLNLERLPVRSELRSGEESKLFHVFGPQEGARIQYQARWFAGIFSKLSEENKRAFLYPNLLMVLLGVKPLYYAVEEDAPNPASLIRSINAQEILAGSRLVFYADESHFIALLPAAVKILSNREWLAQKNVLSPEDNAALNLMDLALRSGDMNALFSKTHELLMKVYAQISSGSVENMEKAHWFYGLLFGYPQEDMESYARAFKTGQKPLLNDPRYVHSRYHKVSLFSENPSPAWISRADAALDYVFSLVDTQPGAAAALSAYLKPAAPDFEVSIDEETGVSLRYLLGLQASNLHLPDSFLESSKSHIDESGKLIREGVLQAPGGKSLILGFSGGVAHSQTYEAMAAKFEEIEIWDLDRAGAEATLGQIPAYIRGKFKVTKAVDFSGVLGDFTRSFEEILRHTKDYESAVKKIGPLLRSLKISPPVSAGKYDYVVSSTILTQLGAHMQRYAAKTLAQRYARTPVSVALGDMARIPEFADIENRYQAAYPQFLRSLTADEGVVYLSDTRSMTVLTPQDGSLAEGQTRPLVIPQIDSKVAEFFAYSTDGKPSAQKKIRIWQWLAGLPRADNNFSGYRYSVEGALLVPKEKLEQLIFPPEVQDEIRRLYAKPAGSVGLSLQGPRWALLNNVFDGSSRDVYSTELVTNRALELVRLLELEKGDTLIDIGAGERGGVGLIAAMLGAAVTAVESRPESVRALRAHAARLKEYIQRAGGSFEIVEADFSDFRVQKALGNRKFKHLILSDVITPSEAMAVLSPKAPPTFQPAKIQSIIKQAGQLKSIEEGRVLFSVPEYVQVGGQLTSGVPFLEPFALEMMRAAKMAPTSATFAAVPYSDGIKRAVLYNFRQLQRSELRSLADAELEHLQRFSGQDWKSVTLEHLEAFILLAQERKRQNLAAEAEEHRQRMTGNLDRPMVRTDGNDFVGLHSAFFEPADPRRKRIVLEQLARVTSALPGALFTGDTVAESRRLFTKLYDSENFADLEDSEAFLAASLYSRSSVRSELRAPDDKSQVLRRVRTETLGTQNRQGTRVLKHESFEGVLWIWAGRFAYRIEPDLLARKFTFQRYSVDKQTPQGSVYSVPFDEDYIVGRGSGAVPGQYVLGTETDNQLSRRHFKLRVSESVWETFFTLEDTGPEGQGSSAGTRAEWTQGDVVISKGFNLHSPPVVRHLSAKVEKLGIQENIPSRGALLPGEFSDGFHPLPVALQARVIQAMRDYSEAGYDLTDYLLDRNLNSMISDALSLQTDPQRIVYHPGIGTRVSNDGQGLAVLRTLIQTDFKTLVASDPTSYSLEEFKTALIRQLGGIAENITVRSDSRGAYLAFFTFNGTAREITAYYGFDASLKNPEELQKGYQVLINRRHAYRPVSLKAKVWAALNGRKPLVMDEAISRLDPVSGFIISDGEDEISNTEVPEPGLIGLDSIETLKRLPSLNSFAFISSLEYLELVYEKYRAAPSAKRAMPVLLGRSSLVLDSFRRKIAASRQKNDGVERFSLFSALRGGPEYAGHGSGSLWMSEQILRSGKLIHKKGFIQYAILNRSTMTSPNGFDSGGSSYDSEGTGLFILDENFNDGVDSVMTFDENGDVVNTIQLEHPKFLAAVFGAHYVRGLKRKYPRHQHKIMSYAEAADYLTRLTREKNRPDDSSSSTRSELRQTAETALQALRPDASADEKRLAAQSVYQSIQIDPDLFLELVQEIFQEKVLEAQDREAGSPQSGDGALALQAALDLARKLLVPKDAALASRKVTMAVHFSKTDDPVSFIQSMIQAVTEGNFSAEVLSDAGTHKAFSRQLTEQLREFFQLKKLKASDLQKGTTASVEGLGIATAMDAAEGADTMNEMFQGLFFDFEDTGEDPDLRLSGQVLFAALLIKLAVLSSENMNIPAADRAAFLKAELIRAVHEAGYSRVSQDSFQALGRNLIRVAGGSLIGSLIDEMKARTQIGQSA